jgi:transposase
MDQLASASAPPGSFGALLRARRHRALLSQGQLAARAELSERTVRNLEAGRVRSPRSDTVRLLAGALELSGPERESWIEAAQSVSHQQVTPRASGPVRPPNDAPAQRPLTARGFGLGNNQRRHRWSAGEDKAEIIELCQRGDWPDSRLTQDRNPTATAFQAWLDLAGRDAGICHDGGLTSAEQVEMAELRRENRRLRENVEILKRATAIFATATWEGIPFIGARERTAGRSSCQRTTSSRSTGQAQGLDRPLASGGYLAAIHFGGTA